MGGGGGDLRQPDWIRSDMTCWLIINKLLIVWMRDSAVRPDFHEIDLAAATV